VPRVVKRLLLDPTIQHYISVATMRKLQQANNVMRDLIDVAMDAPYAQRELGRHAAQNRAMHVQPDSSQRIILVVSIVQLENTHSRNLVHA
jgi:hypothetical protein